MSHASSPSAAPHAVSRPAAANPNREILLSVTCTALAYLGVGLPLAVLPDWVHRDLGFSTVLAGLAISIQYVATIISRGLVGPMADTAGPRLSILVGFACCLASGIAALGAAHLASASPSLALVPLFLSRIALGFGESMIGTGAIAWGIARTQPALTARVISWNGMATYGAIAAGAPLGAWLFGIGGIGAIGLALALTGIAGFAFAWPQPTTRSIASQRMPFHHVLRRVTPYGIALALGAIGFGAISAFIALDYSARGWAGAPLALSAFGLSFVAARLLFVRQIERLGGLRVALIFLGIEIVGLLLVWQAPVASIATLGAGATGFGFALIFPALGMIVVDLVPPQNRGSAIGAYSLFTDVALCATGPAAGYLVGTSGYQAPFLLGAVSALAGAVMVVGLMQAARHRQA
ncbi:MAG TPA: MFS transporter [Novosphingobium capsulatum]|nr:MFS transporter [Novosphingobium capsulatum]